MNNSTCLQPSPATTVALPIIYSCLLPAGIFGNLLAAWIFSRKAPTRRTQYIYLANLVTANLLVCSTMPFLAAYFADGHRWPYESVACRIAHHLGTLVMHVSMYVTITILCSIALSQYATLKKNSGTQHSQAFSGNFHRRLLHKFRRPKFAKYLCVVIWLIVLCITVTSSNIQRTAVQISSVTVLYKCRQQQATVCGQWLFTEIVLSAVVVIFKARRKRSIGSTAKFPVYCSALKWECCCSVKENGEIE